MNELFDESSARRDRIQILADIIAVSIKPVKVSRILRKANIQYNSFNKYMEPLIRRGFMEKQPSPYPDRRIPFVFQSTEAGHGWAERVKEIYDQIQ